MSDITIKTTVCDGVYKCLLTSHPMRALEGLSSEADDVYVAMERLWESIAYYETSTHKPRPRPPVEDVHTIEISETPLGFLAEAFEPERGIEIKDAHKLTREESALALLETLRGEQ